MLMGWATACSGGSDPSPEYWAVLGSSTAAGLGVAAGQGWVALLSAEQQPRGVAVVNLARPGLQSSQALPADAPLVPGHQPPDPAANIDRALALSPRLVILSFPNNDAVTGTPAAETVADWLLMSQRAAQAGATTLVLSTQPRDNLDGRQRAALDDADRLAENAFGPCFVSVRAALSDAQGRIARALSAGDGIHLNAAGHHLIFERVQSTLDSGRCARLSR
jgi:lysophospholipase L1-like esterase